MCIDFFFIFRYPVGIGVAVQVHRSGIRISALVALATAQSTGDKLDFPIDIGTDTIVRTVRFRYENRSGESFTGSGIVDTVYLDLVFTYTGTALYTAGDIGIFRNTYKRITNGIITHHEETLILRLRKSSTL